MDRRMLSLLEKEQSLADTLKKTEKAMQLLPVDRNSFGTMEYLQTVKTGIAAELQKVNEQRIATFDQSSVYFGV